MKYLLSICSLLMIMSCGQKKGCLNQFASNYDSEALVDCCCDFDVNRIIEDLEGTHTLRELCSGSSHQYEIMVVRDENDDKGIIIENFNDRNTSISATWVENEFKLKKEWQADGCPIDITGSVHRNNGKIHFIYAAISQNACENFTSKTCESRGL